MQTLPDSPLGALQIVGRGIELGASGFGKLFMATTLLAFVWLLPTLDTALRLGDETLTPDLLLHKLLGWHWLLTWLLTIGLMLLVQGFVITRLDHIARGGTVNFGAEWREGLRAFPPLLGTALLSFAIAVAAGAMGLIVGAVAGALAALVMGKAMFAVMLMLAIALVLIFVMVYLLFTQFLVVLEKQSPLRAINASFGLVYGRWWHAFTVLLVTASLLIGIMLIAILPLASVLHFGEGSRNGRAMLGQGVLEMILSAVCTPFTLSVMYLTYHDLKLRSRPAA